MSDKLKTNALPLTIIIVALLTLCFVWGPRLMNLKGVQKPVEADPHDHSIEFVSHDDHEEEPIPTDPNQLRALLCEHGIPLIECDECRYEAGVAQIDPNIARGLMETAEIEIRELTHRTLELTGEVQLDLTRMVEVASAGGGRVEAINKFIGDKVTEKELLAVIQSAELGQAQAHFLEVRAQLNLAQQTFERERNLFEQRISSHADYLVAESARAAANAIDAAAKKRLQLLGLNDEQIEAFAEYHPDTAFGQLVINSPMAGTIIEQNIVRGRLVDPNDTLYQVADLTSVWVWCNLYEPDLADVVKALDSGEKLSARIFQGAFPDTTFTGSVDMVGSEVDHATRTMKLRVTTANPDLKLKPGMFVRVLITIPISGSTVEVPESAVLTDEDKHFVFARFDDDLWIRRDVTIGRIHGGIAQVTDGLSIGDIIVTRGAFMLKSEILKEKMGAGCAH